MIADAALALMNATSPWPVVLGIIAYDTPYYGLSPSVFKVNLPPHSKGISGTHPQIFTEYAGEVCVSWAKCFDGLWVGNGRLVVSSRRRK